MTKNPPTNDDLIHVFVPLKMPHASVLHLKASGNPFGRPTDNFVTVTKVCSANLYSDFCLYRHRNFGPLYVYISVVHCNLTVKVLLSIDRVSQTVLFLFFSWALPGQLTPRQSLGVAAVRDHKRMESSTPYRLRQRQVEAQHGKFEPTLVAWMAAKHVKKIKNNKDR